MNELHNQPWLAAEDEQLRAMYSAGVQTHKIARAMGRSRSAVAHRIDRLGMRQRKNTTPPHPYVILRTACGCTKVEPVREVKLPPVGTRIKVRLSDGRARYFQWSGLRSGMHKMPIFDEVCL